MDSSSASERDACQTGIGGSIGAFRAGKSTPLTLAPRSND